MNPRKRNIHLHVMVTADELEFIRERMAEAGVTNAGTFVRRMALTGHILHVDLSPVRELVSLQRRCANNLNRALVRAIVNPAWLPVGKALQPIVVC